jgi:hypothetical protein
VSAYPQRAVEFLADVLHMRLRSTSKHGIKGRAKVRVPMAANMRLVCPVEVVESCYRDKTGKVFCMVHVRHDLYLLIVYDVETDSAGMYALDKNKIDTEGDSVFYRATNSMIMDRIEQAIVRMWVMKRGGKWQHVSADRVV